jgi:hypothetical protein
MVTPSPKSDSTVSPLHGAGVQRCFFPHVLQEVGITVLFSRTASPSSQPSWAVSMFKWAKFSLHWGWPCPGGTWPRALCGESRAPAESPADLGMRLPLLARLLLTGHGSDMA